jgi:hypothetical protein
MKLIRLAVVHLNCAVWAHLAAVAHAASTAGAERPVAPKIWDEKALATWALPVAGVNATPNFYSEAEYYAAPTADVRTYPVYHPDREPAGYMDWLHAQDPKPLVDPAEIESDGDWARLGQRVFDELDQPRFRTNDPRAIKALRDRDLLKTSPISVAPDGQIMAYRWVVEARGHVRLSIAVCTACHTRLQPDGTLLRGLPRNMAVDPTAFPIMAAQAFRSDETGQPLSRADRAYLEYGVPWLKDDIHAQFRGKTEAEVFAITRIQNLGTANRFNGSPFYVTKIPDLTGIKDRRYLDATATLRNRGPEDIARYAAFVASADDGSIGPHRLLSDKQRRLNFHFSDTALYALGRFIYALEPPPNPNPFDERARRGEKIFHEESCAKCHAPPAYTNNKLTRADGFVLPDDHPERDYILARSVHTDPSLALRTRKGTGVYKVPSLRGVWYRGLFEHSGSVATLEDWFDPKRLDPRYVPTGWKGPPGTTTRAVKGHEFGLDLSESDRADLIAFLKTL